MHPTPQSHDNGASGDTTDPLVAEQMASDVLELVRGFVEGLRRAFGPSPRQPQQQPPSTGESSILPLFTRMNEAGLPGAVRTVSERYGAAMTKEDPADPSEAPSAPERERHRLLHEVALPLASLLAGAYQTLDGLPQEAPPAPSHESPAPQSSRKNRRKPNRPAPPRGMLSIQDYTDVACLLEFLVCTGILPIASAMEAPSSSKDHPTIQSRLEDRIRTKLPKSLAGRIPRDALRWGAGFDAANNDLLSLVLPTTAALARLVLLDRFRPMLLPRHLVDIYGACFAIEHYIATDENHSCNSCSNNSSGSKSNLDHPHFEPIGKHYRALGLSLPSFWKPDAATTKASPVAVIDPTLRAMAYQTLLSSSSKPAPTSTKGHYSYRQDRASGLLTDLATGSARGLAAVLTVFVPVTSSSTDPAALMSGASQRLGRTLAATTTTNPRNDVNEALNDRETLCTRFLELLAVAVPTTDGSSDAGIPPRSLAVIQTAWAFLEHLPQAMLERSVWGRWQATMGDATATGSGIHETIRQVGALCAVVPPHSKFPSRFLSRACLARRPHGTSSVLGQILRVATMNHDGAQATRDAEEALLLLTQIIYTGNSDRNHSTSKNETLQDEVVTGWMSALGLSPWDLDGNAYRLGNGGKHNLEVLRIQKHRPLIEPTAAEVFEDSVRSTTARVEFFVEKILLVLAPPPRDTPSAPPSEEEGNENVLQGFPSRIFRFCLKQYLSANAGSNGSSSEPSFQLVATVLLPILCEKCSQEQLLFGDRQQNASGLLLLIREVLSELAEAPESAQTNDSSVDGDDDGHRQEFLKSIAGILMSLLIALVEVGSKARSKEEEDLLQSFLPTLQILSDSSRNPHHQPLGGSIRDEKKDDAAMADMAAYAMALIASRKSLTNETASKTLVTSNAIRSAEERLSDILGEAERDLASTQAPIRAKGMVSLGRLARGCTGSLAKEQKPSPIIQELDNNGRQLGDNMSDWIGKVLELSMIALADKESYVYLAAIQTIVAVGDLHPQRVLPMISSAIVHSKLSFADANDNDHPRTPVPLSQEQVIKLAEALVFIIRRRAVTDEYVPMIVHQMLRDRTKSDASTFQDPKSKDLLQIQRETDNYFVHGNVRNEEQKNENQKEDDDHPFTKQEAWEEQDIRLKTGGPIFDFEETEVVRSLRVTILSELVASASSQAISPHVGILLRLVIQALYLDQESRILQRSAALLARELYGRVLQEATELSEGVATIEDPSAGALIPCSVALVESDEEALSAVLQVFGNGGNGERSVDSTVQARCKEILGIRNQAEEAGVLLAAKLVVEERRQLKELPDIFQSLHRSSPQGATLNPIEKNNTNYDNHGEAFDDEKSAALFKLSGVDANLSASQVEDILREILSLPVTLLETDYNGEAGTILFCRTPSFEESSPDTKNNSDDVILKTLESHIEKSKGTNNANSSIFGDLVNASICVVDEDDEDECVEYITEEEAYQLWLEQHQNGAEDVGLATDDATIQLVSSPDGILVRPQHHPSNIDQTKRDDKACVETSSGQSMSAATVRQLERDPGLFEFDNVARISCAEVLEFLSKRKNGDSNHSHSVSCEWQRDFGSQPIIIHGFGDVNGHNDTVLDVQDLVDFRTTLREALRLHGSETVVRTGNRETLVQNGFHHSKPATLQDVGAVRQTLLGSDNSESARGNGASDMDRGKSTSADGIIVFNPIHEMPDEFRSESVLGHWTNEDTKDDNVFPNRLWNAILAPGYTGCCGNNITHSKEKEEKEERNSSNSTTTTDARLPRFTLCLANEGFGIGMHKHGPALFFLTEGLKKWYLSHPRPIDEAMADGSPTHPGFYRGLSTHQCLQSPGELLLVPNLWYHEIYNLQSPTIGIQALADELPLPGTLL